MGIRLRYSHLPPRPQQCKTGSPPRAVSRGRALSPEGRTLPSPSLHRVDTGLHPAWFPLHEGGCGAQRKAKSSVGTTAGPGDTSLPFYWATPGGAQDLLLALHSGIILGGPWVPTEPRAATDKADSPPAEPFPQPASHASDFLFHSPLFAWALNLPPKHPIDLQGLRTAPGFSLLPGRGVAALV